MALAAGFTDVRGIHRGGCIRRGQDAMRAVTAGAGRHLGIALRQKLPVNARFVSGMLSHIDRGAEFAQVVQIAVAFAAQLRNIGHLGASDEALLFGFDHSEIGGSLIAAVTIRTGDSLLGMD